MPNVPCHGHPHDSDNPSLVAHTGYTDHHKFKQAIAEGFTPIMNLDQNPNAFPTISRFVPTLSQRGGGRGALPCVTCATFDICFVGNTVVV